jgi:acyl-CoA reductase-like NAD-dependent aldehyde dehydrogenase
MFFFLFAFLLTEEGMVLGTFQTQFAELLEMGRMQGTETRKFSFEGTDGGSQVLRAAAAGTKPVQGICGGKEIGREGKKRKEGLKQSE